MSQQYVENEKLCIFLDSPEYLWEWNISADKLFLSAGACAALALSSDNVPFSMTNFLALIPAACRPTLHELREGVLSGASGSFLETTYPFSTFFVRERLIVLERNAKGRATRAMGHYVVSSVAESYVPPLSLDPGMRAQAGPGYWQCSLTDRMCHMDARCAALLGYSSETPLVMPLDEWKKRLHPDEGSLMVCRHQLVLQEALMGDSFEDNVRIRQENGRYARRILCGSVLARDAQGRALHLAGSLQNAETVETRKDERQDGRLLFAINAAGDGLWDWDSITDSVYFSPRYLSMLGYTEEQFRGYLDVWKEKIHPDDYDKIVYPQQRIVSSPKYGDTFECTYRLLCADDTYIWILGRGYVTHRNSEGRATRLVGLHTNITATQNGREKLEELVKNDILTGLRSRNFFDMEVVRIEKNRIRPVSIISYDISGLKLINDYLGHAVGDSLLSASAMLLRQALRATDCVARMGGDEFVVLLPMSTAGKATEILEHIKQQFVAHNANENHVPVFASFGLASTEDPDVPISQLLIHSDRRMLRHKAEHRKEVHTHIKQWIESHTKVTVSLQDSRYEC